MSERFGVYFQVGHWEKTVAFRVNNPLVSGAKIVVCGECVREDQSDDCRNIGGGFVCESCGLPFGRPEAHRKAAALVGLEA